MLPGERQMSSFECGSEEDIFALLIAPFNGCLLGNDALGALGGKVCQME